MPQKIPAFSPSDFLGVSDALQSFRFEGSGGNFTARRETRKQTDKHYWFAYKKVDGKLRKLYLGLPQELTLERLEEMSSEINQDDQTYCSSRPGRRVSNPSVSTPKKMKVKHDSQFQSYPRFWLALQRTEDDGQWGEWKVLSDGKHSTKEAAERRIYTVKENHRISDSFGDRPYIKTDYKAEEFYFIPFEDFSYPTNNTDIGDCTTLRWNLYEKTYNKKSKNYDSELFASLQTEESAIDFRDSRENRYAESNTFFKADKEWEIKKEIIIPVSLSVTQWQTTVTQQEFNTLQAELEQAQNAVTQMQAKLKELQSKLDATLSQLKEGYVNANGKPATGNNATKLVKAVKEILASLETDSSSNEVDSNSNA